MTSDEAGAHGEVIVEKVRGLPIRGTGLGLSILKNLVEANGGRIWVDSVKEKGSAFHFTMPFARGAAAKSPVRAAA